MPIRASAPGNQAVHLSSQQWELVERPVDSKLFLHGPAGCGKTTAGVERMLYLMANGVRGDSILVLVPQRTLAEPYYAALRHPGLTAGGMVTVLTIGGLARRMVDLFWPSVAAQAGFAHPNRPPVFLTLETAQYFMARLVQPLFDQGCFRSVTIPRNRLYSQIIDNLNKAAVTGIPHTEIGMRLKMAWTGESSQLRVYDDAQECANRFRSYCLEHNLLDFSLQLEVFMNCLWPASLCRDYLQKTYRSLVADNLEEDIPVQHDLLEEWLPDLDSTLLIYDQEAGYRSFLGADPESAFRLRMGCREDVQFSQSFVTGPEMQAFGKQLCEAVRRAPQPALETVVVSRAMRQAMEVEPDPMAAVTFGVFRYYPQLIDWVTAEVTRLIDEGVPPDEIVLIAPFLTDALRFSLTQRFEQERIPVRSHRPSRALREEPAVQSLLTLAALAHPDWGLVPSMFDLAYALMQAVEDMDLVRAQLLAQIVYRIRDQRPEFIPFEKLIPEVQNRITFTLGNRYQKLFDWIEAYRQGPPAPVDYFFSRLFGEVLSQPDFGFHKAYTAGEAAANLVESARNFRWVVEDSLAPGGKPLGQEYLEMVQEGVVAAQYIRSWQPGPEEAVLLSPAYTFLLSNRPVSYQFWLDIGSSGWSERLYQPLTHPHVLSRRWDGTQIWTHHNEVEAGEEVLQRITLGLVQRCRTRLYLGLSELTEQGYEHQGLLLKALQRVLRSTQKEALA